MREREPFPALHVYLDMMSQPCRSLSLYLHLTSTPHAAHYLRLSRGEHRTKAIAAINPAQKLPAATFMPAASVSNTMRHTMGESVAIVRLVDALRRRTEPATPALDRMYPGDSDEDGVYARARVDEVLDFYHTTLRLGCGLVTQQYLFKLPAVRTKPEDNPRLALGIEVLRSALEQMEGMVENGACDFLAGTPDASVADIFCAVGLFHVVELGGPLPFLDVSVEFPSVERWLRRVVELDGWNEVHDIFHAACRRLKDKSQRGRAFPAARL